MVHQIKEQPILIQPKADMVIETVRTPKIESKASPRTHSYNAYKSKMQTRDIKNRKHIETVNLQKLPSEEGSRMRVSKAVT